MAIKEWAMMNLITLNDRRWFYVSNMVDKWIDSSESQNLLEKIKNRRGSIGGGLKWALKRGTGHPRADGYDHTIGLTLNECCIIAAAIEKENMATRDSDGTPQRECNIIRNTLHGTYVA